MGSAHPVHLLIINNPGRQSRHYLAGIGAAAKSIGVRASVLELDQLVRWLLSGGQQEAAARARELQGRFQRDGVTHILSYGSNAAAEFGVVGHGAEARSALGELGIRRIHLWTDHPNWLQDGVAIREPVRGFLARSEAVHLVKSEVAARETEAVLGWSGCVATMMAEDPEVVRPVEGNAKPEFDVVAILGGVEAVPEVLTPMLDADDPQPAEAMRTLTPLVIAAWDRGVGAGDVGDDAGMRRLGRALVEARIARPMDGYHRLAEALGEEHAGAIACWRRDPVRYYAGLKALHLLTGWRRAFTTAWLARRCSVGVFGCDASAIGVEQTDEQRAWVPYEDQARVYARGRAALNVNQGHDEEGLTHKPFQIAAAGSVLIHNACRGLEEAFQPGTEALAFDTPREALSAVERVRDGAERSRIADAGRARLLDQHTWGHRLRAWLGA
jgi:hypothetical protein